MSELQAIQKALAQAARRRRWARALRGLWLGLVVGALLSLLMAAAYHLLPLPLWTTLVAALIPLPCMAVGFLIGGWRKPGAREVARWVDQRQHLQERLSTALEVASAPPQSSRWAELVLSDAAEHVKGFDPRRLVPLNLPKATRWALVALVLTAGLGFIPEYRSKAFIQKKADEQNIKAVGKQLTELTRRSLEKRLPTLEPTQKSMTAVTEVGDQLAKKVFTRSEALKDLANVADKLKDQLKEMGQDPAFKKLEETARSRGSEGETAQGLQKQIDAMQKQMGTPSGNPDALDKLKDQLQKMQEQAKGMAGNNNPAGSEADRKKLSDALSALSKQMQEMGMQLPQLDDAIAALAADKTDLVLKDIQASMIDLEKMRDMAKSLQQLQQQMDKVGKDLAEQLKNGQPEAAQMTLQKMVQQLQSANLPPGDMQKMLQEVSKAINPAGNYGKVAEHLKSASGQMQKGNQQDAAKDLAAAAKELESLMQQLGDAQQVQASLDAMEKAQMCIGTCQGWASCNKPGFNPNGENRPGKGVGTWAENDSAGWDGKFTEHWDNSGIVRPDMAAKGQTDRGPGEVSNALKPTKVKGSFSPGGQMPSITLKGVSIKGQSTVGYEEATSAAQSDAQSALSQDKVPRAYQGAVKDYFDDLKK
jgi:hypothetical protein